MKLTYEQHRLLAGTTAECKLVIKRKGKYLKPTPATSCPDRLKCIQAPPRGNHVLTATRSARCRPAGSCARPRAASRAPRACVRSRRAGRLTRRRFGWQPFCRPRAQLQLGHSAGAGAAVGPAHLDRPGAQPLGRVQPKVHQGADQGRRLQQPLRHGTRACAATCDGGTLVAPPPPRVQRATGMRLLMRHAPPCPRWPRAQEVDPTIEIPDDAAGDAPGTRPRRPCATTDAPLA